MILTDCTIKPLSHVDLDEGPNAPPIHEQLKMALAANAVKVITLFKSWDTGKTARPLAPFFPRSATHCKSLLRLSLRPT